MVSVKINGTDASLNIAHITRFTDLIELIKASIDPEHMITFVAVDGREATDADWAASLSQMGSALIEIQTDLPQVYVADKLGNAAEVVRSCYMQFRDARKSFQQGATFEGNQALVKAVNTAKTFFEWYATMLQLVPPEKRAGFDMGKQVEEISESCKKICQQQLYQSWWALGETLEKDLEPRLDKLEDFCRSFREKLK